MLSPVQYPAKLQKCLFSAEEALIGMRQAEAPTVMGGQRKGEASMPWAHLRLPPFPHVAIRLLQLANDENVQLHQLSDLISSDPAFAGEVLISANSLLYAPRSPVTSILHAIAMMGANQLQGMCLTVGVRAYLGKSLNLPAMRNLWRHNLACALIAEELASAGFMDKDIAFTSGMLHDIGRFALAAIRPEEYAALLDSHCGSAASILEREQELLGWNHCDASRRLVVDWRLPADFAGIVTEHHLPRRMDRSWSMSELMKVSCRMADAAGFPAFPGCEAVPFLDLLEELPVRERRLFHKDVEAMASKIAARIQAVEAI
jgi:putative nucleotidyltransferase with HDIG domain